MSNPVTDEFRRFKKLFINYSRVIVGGMILSGMFLFLYDGIRANYVSIVVLTTVVSTISLSLVILLLYLRFHERRTTQPHNRSTREPLKDCDRTDDEEIRKLIAEAIAGLPSTQTKTFAKPALPVAEHVLLSVFQWGHLVGKLFYYGLTVVKLESGFGKSRKEV